MSRDARFAAGDWYAVVGEDVTVLLPAGERTRAAALWELADAGADADAMLDAVLAGGLSSLEHLALLAHDDTRTRLLLRGAVTASVTSVDGDEEVSAVPGTAWAERLLTGVTGLRVSLGGAEGDVEHPLTPGLARVSVVAYASEAPSAPSAPAPTPARLAEPQPEPEPESEPQPEPEPEPVPAVDPAAAAPMSFGEPADDPTPTGETPLVAGGWSDNDGHTRAGAPVADVDRPPVTGQEATPEVLSRPVAALVFSTGDVVAVDRTVLVGRAPEARRFASHDQPHVVTVPSPQQEISSTHLEIRPGAGADHGSAIATDLGSTNGTVLAQPGLDPEELTPGIAVSLVPGAVIDLGDGVTIQVTNP